MTIETSASIENLAAALGKFQAETHGVVRDAVNPFHKNRYATLEAVIETARPGLAKAGLAFLQAPSGLLNLHDSSGSVGYAVGLETLLMHGASGEWIRFTTAMPLTKTDPQGVGSAITYACRYALMAMLGLPPLDDDAEATKPRDLAPNRSDGRATPEQMTDRFTAPATGPVAKSSKDIYIDKAIKRMVDFASPSDLLNWAKNERKMVWPQYGIDPFDEDGQRLVTIYKERMAELEQNEEEPE